MLNELKWMIDSDAQATLNEVRVWREESVPLHIQAKRLRKQFDGPRAQAIMELSELREKAKRKFTRAESMLLTRVGLEQSSSEALARYKGQRFPKESPVVDLCCGIGGDLIGLTAQTSAHAWDQDPLTVSIARFNAQDVYGAAELAVEVGQVPEDLFSMIDPDQPQAWHIDPDRRALGTRSIDVEEFSPNAADIDELRKLSANGAAKLAPASDCPEHWIEASHREFIGEGKECKQQVVWFGELAGQFGTKTATLIDQHGASIHSIQDDGEGEHLDCHAPGVAGYLYEPHSVLSASRLTATVGRQLGFSPLAAGHEWLTSDSSCDHSMLSRYRILTQSSLREANVKKALRDHQIGRVEVKLHGVTDKRWQQFRWKGDGQQLATLLITRLGEQRLVLLCQREATLASDAIE